MIQTRLEIIEFIGQEVVVICINTSIVKGRLITIDHTDDCMYIMFAKDSLTVVSFNKCEEVLSEREWFARKLDYILEL